MNPISDQTRQTSTLTVEAGGVMTNEVGVVTGELEVTTEPTPGGTGVIVSYVGSPDRYTVTGSPIAGQPSHEDVVNELARDRGTGPDGNAMFRDLTALEGASAPVDSGDEGTLG